MGVLAAMIWADWSKLPRFAGVAVAYSYLLSVVLLREGTGGGLSGFGVLFMLPVLWVALYGERWEVIAVVVGVGVAMAAPIVLVGSPEYSTTEWRKLTLLVMVCAVVGWSVKTLVDRLGAALEVQARETANLGRLAALNRTHRRGGRQRDGPRRDLLGGARPDRSLGGDAVGARLDDRLEVTSTSDPELRGASVAVDQHHSGVASAYRDEAPCSPADAFADSRLDAELVKRFGATACLFWPVRLRSGRWRW